MRVRLFGRAAFAFRSVSLSRALRADLAFAPLVSISFLSLSDSAR
jgi:hypothetical protein